MATISKSDAKVFTDPAANNYDNSDGVVSIGAEESANDDDGETKIRKQPKTFSSKSIMSMSRPSSTVPSLQNKTMIEKNHSSLSVKGYASQNGDGDHNEMYHFKRERDEVVNTDSDYSSQKELRLSSTSLSDFGKYERADTANEEDLITAQQFMFTLAKVRIYME